jgi:hypothetical protein
MKSILTVLAAATLLLVFAGKAPAEQILVFPADKPVFSIGFPDDWKVKPDPDYAKGISVFSPDKEIEIELWVLDDKWVHPDPVKAIANSVEEVSIIVREWVTVEEVDSLETFTHNGIRFFRRKGAGKAREDGSPIKVSAYFFSPDKKSSFVLMYWGSEAAERKYNRQLKRIAHSVRRP